MKRINYWLRSSFGFSKMEANGIMILLPLMALIIFSPYLYQYFQRSFYPSPLESPEINKFYLELKEEEKNDSIKRYKKWDNSYYALEKKSWNKAQTKEPIKGAFKSYSSIEPFDINLADTTKLKRVKGVGKVLSNRIVKYRNLLGGFVSLDQLKEVYGLKDSVLISLDTLVYINDSSKISLLPINVATEYELKRHPYINSTEAKAITNYRFQHGAFNSIIDIYKIRLLDSVKIGRLEPYLDFSVGTQE